MPLRREPARAKKAIRLATRMALAAKINDNQVTLIDQLGFRAAQNQGDGRQILKALKLTGASLLVRVSEGYNVNVYRSIRNLAGVSVLPVSELECLADPQARRC